MLVNRLMGAATQAVPENPRIEFWRDQAQWPHDAGGYIFAGRALLKLGKHLFPEAWSDEVPTLVYDSPLPKNLSLHTPIDVIKRAIRLLQENETSYSNRVGSVSGLLGNITESQFPTTEEWADAVHLDKEMRDQVWPKFSLFLKTSLAMRNASLSRTLQSATRKYEGGEIVDQEWHFWNYEFSWSRFHLCRVASEDPSRNIAATDQSDWIYFKEESLQDYIDGPASPENLDQIEVARVAIVKTRQSRAGRRPRYEWPALAAVYRQLCAKNIFSEDTSTSKIADTLLDSMAEVWEEIPEKRSVEQKVREWREIRL